jgi:hypothetical protein
MKFGTATAANPQNTIPPKKNKPPENRQQVLSGNAISNIS